MKQHPDEIEITPICDNPTIYYHRLTGRGLRPIKTTVKIGDVFIAKSDDKPGIYWCFRIISILKQNGEYFYPAVKLGVAINEAQLVLFQYTGRTMNEYRDGLRFYLTGKSKKKATSFELISN